ncbi:MAG TPA: helical backbone metal receptor [Acidimicrobiales bacterium]|nr:helical backbone metal receptor [Acidimicrobiales bacterium]
MPPRVVSLMPSVTETLVAWGVQPLACTRFCEQPDLPHVGGTKNPDIAAIISLGPDLVVVDTEENRIEDADALREAGLELFVTTVTSIDHVDPTLAALGVAVGVTPAHSALVPAQVIDRRAFVPIWRRPWMALGRDTYGSSLLARLGIANVCTEDDGRYPELDLNAASERAPDLVVAPSEPYRFDERHRSELERVAPVTFVDGQDLFWWGSRTPTALTRLSAALA